MQKTTYQTNMKVVNEQLSVSTKRENVLTYLSVRNNIGLLLVKWSKCENTKPNCLDLIASKLTGIKYNLASHSRLVEPS